MRAELDAAEPQLDGEIEEPLGATRIGRASTSIVARLARKRRIVNAEHQPTHPEGAQRLLHDCTGAGWKRHDRANLTRLQGATLAAAGCRLVVCGGWLRAEGVAQGASAGKRGGGAGAWRGGVARDGGSEDGCQRMALTRLPRSLGANLRMRQILFTTSI